MTGGTITNTLGNYLWNGVAFMEAVDSRGGSKYPFSLDMSSMNDLFGSGRITARLWDMDDRAPSVPPGGYTLTATASAQNGTGTSQGFPLFIGGTPYSSYYGGFFEVTASGNYLNGYNLVLKYPISCSSLKIMSASRVTADAQRGTIQCKLSAESGVKDCNLTGYFEEVESESSTWTASGTFLDVTPANAASHIYVPWCSYYTGPAYISQDYKDNAVFIEGGVDKHAYQDVNNEMLWYESGTTGSSNSAIDERLAQGFIIPTNESAGEYTMSAKFSSNADKRHAYCIRNPGTRTQWYGTAGWATNRFRDGTNIVSSSSPSTFTTGSGVIGPSYTKNNLLIPMRPFVSAEGTGSGTWTASGTVASHHYEPNGVRLEPV